MKNLELDVITKNFGLLGPNSWKTKQWKIYDDMSVEICTTYTSGEVKENNITIGEDIYNSIIENVELSKSENQEINAVDGNVWEITKYKNGQEVYKREQGYIYGIKSLESIASLLISLVESE